MAQRTIAGRRILSFLGLTFGLTWGFGLLVARSVGQAEFPAAWRALGPRILGSSGSSYSAPSTALERDESLWPAIAPHPQDLSRERGRQGR